MRGGSLHRSLALVATAAVFLVAATGARAADPQHIHFAFSVPSVTDDFCGSGATITDLFSGHANVWLDPNQPIDNRNIGESDDVFTNPATSASVIIHSAYQFTGVLVSGDPNGIQTFEWTFKGAGQVIRSSDGGVLSHDTGYLVVRATFDGDDFNAQIVVDRGPHPGFEDGSRFCNVMLPALGLG